MPTGDTKRDAATRAGPGPAAVLAQRTLAIEVEALRALEDAFTRDPLRKSFERVVTTIARSAGRVIVSGMGKSGLVGRKIASTFASTGTPSFFIHPAEASHGDLGMIGRSDVVLAISWSGETAELSDIVSYCRRYGVTLVALTACSHSSLAKQSDIVLELPSVVEACPNNLAPTSSTMLQAAMGDALAVALIEVCGFSADDFRLLHPRGTLGAKLLRVGDLMSVEGHVPKVSVSATILIAMLEMSQKRFGITAVVDDDDRLLGAFTDGDLRRGLTMATVEAPVRDYMSASPLCVAADLLATEALALMNERNIMQLFVTHGDDLVGIVHLHDILRAGVV